MLAAVLAVGDWILVSRGGGERADASIGRWITKPSTMVALIAAVLVSDGGGAIQGWLLAGLVLSLAGDVFLLWPSGGSSPGLARSCWPMSPT